ncbi:hypothetical protein SSX86_013456 [Deinandra increscens subsp. villosa]|uniref:non-specific serine/threonine protein kinase n=1 Tax=Deinandra increscens subsp. villosa TaxID=3103831 RepID=A0AAP0H151_9ASTR
MKLDLVYLSSMLSCFPLIIYSSVVVVVSSLNSDGQTLLSLASHWSSSIPPSWNASHPDPCLWEGVLCRRGSVVSLNLSACDIRGEIGPEISRLTHLRSLDLSFNTHLSGNIPHTLGNLLHLRSLSLSNNSLNGSIPDSIFRIPTLEELLLSFNHLTGFIPSNLGNATMLQTLCLDNNHFTGSLPHSLTNLRNLVYLDAHSSGVEGRIPPLGAYGCHSLVYLDLSFNRFVGALIPPELGNCSSLEQFALVGCGLTGPIPSSFGQLTSLTLLYLSINNLSGNIPPELANCSSLTDLQLNRNQLQGSIPPDLGRLKLTALYLFTNRLTGEVPMSIWKIHTLEELLIYQNRLSGELPPEVAQLNRLKQFTLYDNHFSGIIPQSLGINGSLTILDFYNNSFAGPVPPNLCAGNQLEKLVLGFNSFQGGIPSEFGNCPSLRRLIIDNANLTGALPDFVNNPNLLYMNLEGNRFTGQIPGSSFGKLTNITEINLSMNRLSGFIPQELGSLLQLQGLDLSHNALEGPLPPQLASCSRLLNINVSHNSLNGSIPAAALRTMSGLLTLDLSQNQFSGSIPAFISEFQALIDLRLAGNPLGGPIPSSIIELKTLVTLNISNNDLTGDIPSGFSKLVMLQQLDVSRNHLTGPLAPLSELHVLTDLNISYNLFTGPIPANLLKLLNSSVYSFLGNPGLCVDSSRRCTSSNSDRQKKGLTKFQTAMVALWTSAFLFAVAVGLGFIFRFRQREKHGIERMYGDKEDNTSLLHKVMEATEDLNDRYVIGRGAHGTVYKASLGPEGVYAVKKLTFGSCKEGSTSMVREIETVGKVRHRNLVRLEDFWMKKDYGLILYRYMHNGSLHDILHEVYPPPVLDWSIRCNIALGTAHGLAYLHFDCDPPIVHRDIKPMNILLDAELEPHISDFGIAKLLDQSSAALMSGTLRGTIGYIAPENAFTSTKSKESDVYSYGVVLLELMTRKRAVDPSFADGIDIVKWVRSVWNEKREVEVVVDAAAAGLYDDSFVREQVTRVLRLALRCTQTEPSTRPSMRDVVKELEDVYTAVRSKIKA